MQIEIVYANKSKQILLSCEVTEPTTIKQAIEQSGILQQFPEIDISDSNKNPVGIFGQKKPLDTILEQGDRIEIYRPLIIDPKQARRLRAQRSRNS